MSNTVPFTDAHAIACLDFALTFENDLSDEERDRLALAFQAHLDQFERVDVDDDDEPPIAFDRKDEDGDVVESVHIHRDYVHVIWFDYRGWSFSRDGVIAYLRPVLDRAREGQLALSSVVLAYRDVFFNEAPDTYDAREVLRDGSQYVAPKIFSSGQRWRHWLAWGNEDDKVTTYATLRINAFLTGDDDTPLHCTEITHRQSLRWRDAILLAKPSDEDLRHIWNDARGVNRVLIRELLTDDMLEHIGLREGIG